ncbi:MAG TPA: hypothetical protein VJK03_01415 [Candidatus Nanoarchaeia archaeon]|nr:hypothetical protein [Candidatus Nanoarchaeia archaeon]
MTWRVILSPDVQKSLDKQDPTVRERLKTEDPFHYLEHFEGEDYYKYRIGDYRALIDINFQEKILKIQVLDKRGRIYK